MVKITLIMPFLNAEKCLKQSIANILNQSLEDFELICVDDKSEDNSLKRLLEYSSEDNRIIVNHDEKNLMQSLNESISQATGEYILFVDSDNLMEDNVLEQLHDKTKEYSPDILLTKSQKSNDKTSKLLALNQNKTFNHNQIIDLIFEMDNSLYNKVYNKEFLLKNKLFFNTELSEDYETFFYKSLLKADKISYYNQQIYKTDNNKTEIYNIKQFIQDLKTQNNIYGLFNQEKYIQQAINNKINNTINQYNKTSMDDKKEAYILLREDYLSLLNQNDSERLINLLDEENHKSFEQIIISETVEEYELIKAVYQDKKTVNYNKRYEKILKDEHKKIKRFNDSLKSSKSWKLTKIFRLR